MSIREPKAMKSTVQGVNGSAAEILASAEAMAPRLLERRLEIDAQRQLPQDLAESLARAGFYRLVVPASLGGLGLSPADFCRLCERLAIASGSAAWCVFIGSTSQYLFGALDDQFLSEVLEDANVLTSGVFADSGTVTAEQRNGQHGFLVNGHWRWGSGCHNAAWISGGVHEVDQDGKPLNRDQPLARVFFKPDEIEIQDNWHVSGLRGTGSSDFIARNVWVPSHRVCGHVEDTARASLPIYRFPKFGLLGAPIGAIALGMARGSIDEVKRIAIEKTPQGSRKSLAHRSSLHAKVAQSETIWRAARGLLYDALDQAWLAAETAEATLEQRLLIRTANNHAVNVSIDVIDTMYTAVGGSSVFEDSVLQQYFRDVHVASQHMMVGEPVMELAGRVLLGLDEEGLGL